MNGQVKLSVGELIEYVMRSGDINAVFLSSKRMSDGVKAHQKFQKQSGETYDKEVSISYTVHFDGLEIILSGRMDGVIKEGEWVLIDEIKSTNRNLDEISEGNHLHWAQVLIYAYMYCKQYQLLCIQTRLTYIELEYFKIKQFVLTKTINELEAFFYEVVEKYVAWARVQMDFRQISKVSIQALNFPFEGFRYGQKLLMSGVYKTIEERKILFSRAPTGIGKTIATLYPAIKALGNDKCEKIFYLTAKNIGKQVALDTLALLGEKGLCVKRVAITAKDKICLMEQKKCDPDYCLYARGHFDRINNVIEEMYQRYDCFDREVIERYAILHQVCPYELSLDLATFSDVIVCDYNYAFDPSAMLKRFFMEDSGKFTLLIDEAHNLVDRAREMYSASLDKETVLDLKKKVKDFDGRLYQYFTKLNQFFVKMRKRSEECKDGAFFELAMPTECEEMLRGIIYRTEKIFSEHREWPYMEDLLNFYFDSYDFLKKMELYDECYVTYYQKERNNLIIKMFCINPSQNIKNVISNMQGVVYFSATLLPMDYYIQLLGGDEQSYGMTLPSPFDQNKLCLLIHKGISTKYSLRGESIGSIVETIEVVTNAKKGNYMVFFPSYKYMESVCEAYSTVYIQEKKDMLIQKRTSSDFDKEEFLNEFYKDREKTLVAFVVLGGVYGEGIDLTGDKLSGAIVVGVGLPQICFERDLIKDHFNQGYKQTNGYEYAYVYPGFNKVMQSAGRVIRSLQDIGIVVLIEQRFSNHYYRKMFPDEWSHVVTVDNIQTIEEILSDFWDNT